MVGKKGEVFKQHFEDDGITVRPKGSTNILNREEDYFSSTSQRTFCRLRGVKIVKQVRTASVYELSCDQVAHLLPVKVKSLL